MAKLQTDTLQGGRLVDRDGRRQVVLVDVNAAKQVTDQIEGGTLTDQDGREYVAVQASLATKIASLSGNPADDVKALGAGTGAPLTVLAGNPSGQIQFSATANPALQFDGPNLGDPTRHDAAILQLTVAGNPRFAVRAQGVNKSPWARWDAAGGAWGTGIDVASVAAPDRDLVLAFKLDYPTPGDEFDFVYVSHNGSTEDPTLGIGKPQPGADFRTRILGPSQSANTGMGLLSLEPIGSAKGRVVAGRDSALNERLVIDGSTSNWKLQINGPITSDQPAFVIRDSATTYKSIVLGRAGLVSYWRLNGAETATDNVGASSNTGTYVGGVSRSQPGPLVDDGDTAITLDGVSGFVTVPDAASLRIVGDLTLEAWVNPTDRAATYVVIGKGTNGRPYELSIGTDGKPVFQANGVSVIGTNPIPTGVWSHIAVTRSGTTITHSLNGVANGSGSAATTTDTGAALRIGANTAGGALFKGSIDEVSIYNVAVSAGNLLIDFNAGATPGGEQLRISSQGKLRFNANDFAVLSYDTAGTNGIKASNNLTVVNRLGVGPGVTAGPTQILDVATTAGSDAVVAVRTAANGNMRLIASDASATCTLQTQNASKLVLGTNGVARITMPAAGGAVIGNAALATTATDGFLYIPTCAGTPTGAPTAQTGTVPIVFDSTNNFLYVFNGTWKKSTVYA